MSGRLSAGMRRAAAKNTFGRVASGTPFIRQGSSEGDGRQVAADCRRLWLYFLLSRSISKSTCGGFSLTSNLKAFNNQAIIVMSKRRFDDHPVSPVRSEDPSVAPPQVAPTKQTSPVRAPVATFTSIASLNATSYAFGQRVEFVGMFSSIARIFAASTVYDELFTHCAAPDPTILARIARTCRPARNAVHEYLTRRWNTQLKDVFKDPHEFRALQARLGFLVARYQEMSYNWAAQNLSNIALTISATKADETELLQFLEHVAKLKPVRAACPATREWLNRIDHTHRDSRSFMGPSGVNEDKLPYTICWFVSQSSEREVQPVRQCHLIISNSEPAGSASLIAPFLTAPQHFDIFSWRTCWTPYPRITYINTELQRDTDTVTLGWQVAVMVAKRSPVVKEMIGERWLGDGASWTVQLSTEAVEELLPADFDSAQLDDSHFALNGWSMETQKLVTTGYDDVPHFQFPQPRWDQVGPGPLNDDTSSLGRCYTAPYGFVSELKDASPFRQSNDNVGMDGILLERIRAFQRLRRAQKIYSSPPPTTTITTTATSSSLSTTRTTSGSPRRKNITGSANTSTQTRSRGGRSAVKGRAQTRQLVDGMKTLDLTGKGETVDGAEAEDAADSKPAPFLLNIPI